MKIIKPSVEFFGAVPTDYDSAIRFIELAGRTCYKSEDKITEGSAEKFVRKLIKAGHLAMVEHSNFVVQLVGFSNVNFLILQGEFGKYLNVHLAKGELYVGGNITAWYQAFRTLTALDEYPSYPEVFIPFIDTFGHLFDLHNEVPAFTWQVCAHDDIPAVLHRYSAKFICDRGACYDDKTEVLTQNGFKLFKDLTANDAVWTMNNNTKQPEYQTPTEHHNYDWDGELIGGHSSMVDFLVTPNHRMYFYPYDKRINKEWKIDEVRNIYNKRIKFQRGLFSPYSEQPVPVNFPQQNTLPFARFLGMFITDGSKDKTPGTGGRINLHQIKDNGRRYIKNFLDQLKWNYQEKSWGFQICDELLYKFINDNFTNVRHKNGEVPYWIKEAPVDYLKHFISAVIIGDGNRHPTNGHEVIYTTNKKLADDYQECILRLGLCSSIRIDDRTGQERILKGNIIKNTKPCYIISITTRTNEHLFNKINWYKKDYIGKVYCVSVQNGIIYVRRNGKSFWSGNSHELVRHRPCSFAQESTRYVNYGGKDMEFVEPAGFEEWEKNEKHYFKDACRYSEIAYQDMIDAGLKPQQARAVLPNALKTEIVVTADTAEWSHIRTLRTSAAAQPDMQRVMNMMPWNDFL